MRNLAILILLLVPAMAMAQDIPPVFVPTEAPKSSPDWPTIIDKIGQYLVTIITAVLAFLAQYRAGNAVKKADEALEQSKSNEEAIKDEGRKAKSDLETQTVAITKIAADQTKDLLLAKIAEKPVVVPIPTIPPVE